MERRNIPGTQRNPALPDLDSFFNCNAHLHRFHSIFFGNGPHLAGVSRGDQYSGRAFVKREYLRRQIAIQVDRRADVYALGAILYELLTLRPPFRGATDLDTLQMIRFEEPVSPERIRPDVPRDLATICLKCIAKDSAKRFASVRTIAAPVGVTSSRPSSVASKTAPVPSRTRMLAGAGSGMRSVRPRGAGRGDE